MEPNILSHSFYSVMISYGTTYHLMKFSEKQQRKDAPHGSPKNAKSGEKGLTTKKKKKKIFDLLEGGICEMVTPNAERAKQTR